MGERWQNGPVVWKPVLEQMAKRQGRVGRINRPDIRNRWCKFRGRGPWRVPATAAELLPDPAAEVFAGGVFQAWNIVQIIVVELLVDRQKIALISAKSRIQPVCGSTSPSMWMATRNEWPCRRPHLWPSGTWGRRWADSKVNSLKSSTVVRSGSGLSDNRNGGAMVAGLRAGPGLLRPGGRLPELQAARQARQVGAIQAQLACSRGPASLVTGQAVLDQVALVGVGGRAQRVTGRWRGGRGLDHAARWRGVSAGRSRSCRCRVTIRDRSGLWPRALRRGAADQVLEFAHVARPAIVEERGLGLVVQAQAAQSQARSVFLEEVAGQQEDIAAALTQRLARARDRR